MRFAILCQWNAQTSWDGDRVGNIARAVGVKLKLINERDDDKGERPAEAGSDNQITQKYLLAAGRRSRCSLHCG